MIICSIKDNIVGEFMNPIMLSNEEEAKRAFETAVNAPNGQLIAKYNKDMDLYKIAEFDPKTGEIKPCKEYIINGASLKKDSAEEKIAQLTMELENLKIENSNLKKDSTEEKIAQLTMELENLKIENSKLRGEKDVQDNT